jgi:hypothetical protein
MGRKFFVEKYRNTAVDFKRKKCTTIIFSRPVSCKLVLTLKVNVYESWAIHIKMVIVVSFYTAGEGKLVIKETVT